MNDEDFTDTTTKRTAFTEMKHEARFEKRMTNTNSKRVFARSSTLYFFLLVM
jgi:hypothetical protein